MANLTSKEWRDLIFNDKNKEFGAYNLRKNSEKRHTLAVIFTLVGLAIIVLAVIGYSKLQDKWAADAEEEARLEREKMKELAAQMEVEDIAPEEEEDIYIAPEEIEVPEMILEEDLAASTKQTQILIADEVINEVRNMEENKEDDTARGVMNQEGSDDIDNHQALKEDVQIVQELPPEPEPVKPQPKDEEIFKVVEQPPTFPGGEQELMKWLGNNLQYPIRAQENGISGRVIVGFVVEKDGSISNVQVVKGVDKDLDNEAIRVVKKMPKWQPGKNNGHAVRAFFNLPVKFELK